MPPGKQIQTRQQISLSLPELVTFAGGWDARLMFHQHARRGTIVERSEILRHDVKFDLHNIWLPRLRKLLHALGIYWNKPVIHPSGSAAKQGALYWQRRIERRFIQWFWANNFFHPSAVLLQEGVGGQFILCSQINHCDGMTRCEPDQQLRDCPRAALRRVKTSRNGS